MNNNDNVSMILREKGSSNVRRKGDLFLGMCYVLYDFHLRLRPGVKVRYLDKEWNEEL